MKKHICHTLLAGAVLALGLQQAVAGDSDSGFIKDMPELEHDAERPGAMIWVKPGVDRTVYSQVMIAPLTIYVSPDSRYQGLDADDLKALADKFQQTLTLTLEPEVPVLNKAGPGVAYLRAAVTNLKLAEKKRGLLSFTPVGLVVHAATDVAGMNISLKEAVLEMEMLDSVSGERLGVLVDKAPETRAGEELSWDSIDETFTFYAERLKTRMHKAP